MVHHLTKLSEWTTPEFIHQKKNNDWYWGLGIIAVAFIVIAILDKNFLLGIMIIMITIIAIYLSHKKPIDIHVEISDQGLRINETYLPYQNIKSFWIDQGVAHWLLLLQTNKKVNPLIIVPIDPEIDPVEIRQLLLEYLPEIEQKEPLFHKISERLGF